MIDVNQDFPYKVYKINANQKVYLINNLDN